MHLVVVLEPRGEQPQDDDSVVELPQVHVVGPDVRFEPAALRQWVEVQRASHVQSVALDVQTGVHCGACQGYWPKRETPAMLRKPNDV